MRNLLRKSLETCQEFIQDKIDSSASSFEMVIKK